MDLLFRLKQKIDGFENIERTKEFFSKTLLIRDKNYFYDSVKRGDRLQKDDVIYFAYDSYIIAKGIYTGDILPNLERDEIYIYGHKLKDIQILDSNIRLNSDLVGTRTTYIDSESKMQEINSVLNSFITIFPDEINENDTKIIEGAKKQVTVNIYERDPRARAKCIEKYGYICSVCKFDFKIKYGDIGKDFIHVHHLKQLSEIKEAYEINPIKDLRPVCPNCHAMLHKKNPAYTIEEIKKIIG